MPQVLQLASTVDQFKQKKLHVDANFVLILKPKKVISRKIKLNLFSLSRWQSFYFSYWWICDQSMSSEICMIG